MKKINFILFILVLFTACNDGADVRGIPGPAEVEAVLPEPVDLEVEMTRLEAEGFEVSLYEIEDRDYIRQKYFLALLKDGPNQEQAEIGSLQEFRANYLEKMAEEEYVSLAGPVSDRMDVWGIVIFKTPTIEKADSLVKLNPIVKEGKVELEIYPWWVTKGGQLD